MEDKNSKKRDSVKLLTIIVSSFFVVSVSYFFVQMDKLVSFYENRAYPGQFIDSENIAGYTKNELEALLDDLELNYSNNRITLSANNKVFNNEGLHIDLEAINKDSIIENALNFYKDENFISKSLFLCRNAILPNKNWAKIYDLELDYNSEKLEKYINDIKLDVDVTKKEPTLDMKEYGELIVLDGVEGYNLNVEETIEKFEKNINLIKNNSFEIDVVAKIEPITLDKKIFENVDTKISSYTTTYARGNGRATNVELAADRINKTVLLPGDEFSVNKTILQRTKANGYKGAPEYSNGKVIQGIGGGVCQVSTTLYGAQLRAGILPKERYAHSMTVAYAPIGLDAAIYEDILDLKFINPYEYPIYINSYTNGGKLTMEFWSNKNATNGIRYEPKSYKRTSLSADAYLYGYDSENKEVYKEYLGKSNYREPKKEDTNN